MVNHVVNDNNKENLEMWRKVAKTIWESMLLMTTTNTSWLSIGKMLKGSINM
jgi:hypothetical protein